MKFTFYDLNMYLLKSAIQGFSHSRGCGTITLPFWNILIPRKKPRGHESHAPAPSPHWPSPRLCGSPCGLDFSYKRSLTVYSLR